jgi:hypothetical protein
VTATQHVARACTLRAGFGCTTQIIQLGLTLANDKGELPEDICTWQFNFHFTLKYGKSLAAASRPV